MQDRHRYGAKLVSMAIKMQSVHRGVLVSIVAYLGKFLAFFIGFVASTLTLVSWSYDVWGRIILQHKLELTAGSFPDSAVWSFGEGMQKSTSRPIA